MLPGCFAKFDGRGRTKAGAHHPFIEAWRKIEAMEAIGALTALVRKETKKETNSSRTWKIETGKQTSQVALSKRSQMAPTICSATSEWVF